MTPHRWVVVKPPKAPRRHRSHLIFRQRVEGQDSIIVFIDSWEKKLDWEGALPFAMPLERIPDKAVPERYYREAFDNKILMSSP